MKNIYLIRLSFPRDFETNLKENSTRDPQFDFSETSHLSFWFINFYLLAKCPKDFFCRLKICLCIHDVRSSQKCQKMFLFFSTPLRRVFCTWGSWRRWKILGRSRRNLIPVAFHVKTLAVFFLLRLKERKTRCSQLANLNGPHPPVSLQMHACTDTHIWRRTRVHARTRWTGYSRLRFAKEARWRSLSSLALAAIAIPFSAALLSYSSVSFAILFPWISLSSLFLHATPQQPSSFLKHPAGISPSPRPCFLSAFLQYRLI